ncbi:unnamed protein product [Ambrosiozyma monospora]|uniref:Unnamed protein product n=1 Tax=Ambrosiozyma monospora TaxID=43982 RepID=A0ACB5U6I6_AMBMO|nr:unnamed protein product [Ambrosiozyma monospora]
MFAKRALVSRVGSIKPVRFFNSTSLKNQELIIRQDDASSPTIQAPTIERLKKDAGIPGVISPNVLNDVWFNQVSFKLEDLKYGMAESINRTDLESCFVVQSNSLNTNPFLGQKRAVSEIMEEYILTTNNKVIDQYYKLLTKTAKEPSEDLVFQSTSSIYNIYQRKNHKCAYARLGQVD